MTHIRFYLDGRKNNQHGGNFQDVARPEDPNVFGVYHVCLLARATFGRGIVLRSVDSAGVVNLDACMSHKQFVAHLREALVDIGLTREMAGVYSAHSMRAGGGHRCGSPWPAPRGNPAPSGRGRPELAGLLQPQLPGRADPRLPGDWPLGRRFGVWGLWLCGGRSLKRRELFHASQPQIPRPALPYSSCLVHCYLIVPTSSSLACNVSPRITMRWRFSSFRAILR